MLRILLDKNVPYSLKPYLVDFHVRTAEEEGWSQISNGELINSAEAAGYQVMLTCDQNVQYQQNLVHRKLSLLVLGSNIWPSVKPRVSDILAALHRASEGSFEFIEIAPPPRRRRVADSPDA